MENSIEEDIKIVENYLAHSAINETDSDFFKNGGWETVDLEIPESMQHILSDYKRVLKENEEKTTILLAGAEKVKQLEKENKDLKADNYELNNRITDLLENIPIQKVKDKIEELKLIVEKYDRQRENDEDTALCYEEVSIYWSKIEAYEELLGKEQ